MKTRFFHRAGVTLTEMAMAVALLGLTAFMVPLALKIFNSLSSIQQLSQLQTQAKNVLWQMNHEIENAVSVETSFSMPDHIRIKVYDVKQYTTDDTPLKADHVYESSAMFKPEVTVPAGRWKLDLWIMTTQLTSPTVCDNYGTIIYSIYNESETGVDMDEDGKLNSKPYLLKITAWPYSVPAINRGNTMKDLMKKEVFFRDRIDATPAGGLPTFSGNQLINVNLRLRPAFSKPGSISRIFTAVMNVRSPRQ